MTNGEFQTAEQETTEQEREQIKDMIKQILLVFKCLEANFVGNPPKLGEIPATIERAVKEYCGGGAEFVLKWLKSKNNIRIVFEDALKKFRLYVQNKDKVGEELRKPLEEASKAIKTLRTLLDNHLSSI